MTNADKFKSIFGLYATELWAKPEKDFLEWLNADDELFGNSEQLDDTISRQVAIDALYDWGEHSMTDAEAWHIRQVIGDIKSMPSAQPNLSEAYSKAVFTWLMNYQIRTAELKGRYTPYEVLSWVINDWRKENG